MHDFVRKKFKDSPLRKINVILVLGIIFLFTACSQKKVKKKNSAQSKCLKILEQSKEQPFWVEETEEVIVYKNTLVIAFVAYGESKNLEWAKEAAMLNGKTTSPTALKSLAVKQREKAFRLIGIPEQQSKSSSDEEIFSYRYAPRPDAKKLIKIDEFYHKVKKRKICVCDSKDMKCKMAGFHKPSYEYYVRFILPYSEHVLLRNKGVKSWMSRNPITKTKRVKKIMVEFMNALHKIDNQLKKK